MDKNISRIIIDVCQKERIDYTSPYQQEVLHNDAKRLGEIVQEIEGLIDEIDCLFNRHNVDNGIKHKIKKELKLLHLIDHDLLKLAFKIKNEK